MSVNEVLDPWLMLSGEEGPNPGERSKNGGIIGHLESSRCSPEKIVTVTTLWVGRLAQRAKVLATKPGMFKLQHPHGRKGPIIIQQYFLALPRWEHVCIQYTHTYTINKHFSY